MTRVIEKYPTQSLKSTNIPTMRKQTYTTQRLQIQVALSFTAADPGFPRRGHQHGGWRGGEGGVNLLLCQIFQKTEEK